MKKSIAILLLAAALFAGSFSAVAFADSDVVLVTKEYFDSVITAIEDKIDAENNSSASSEYIVLENLKSGTIITGGASCEMILRSGAAKAYIPSSAGGGLSDLTSGSNISDGKQISANHLLLFPRDDGRSLLVTKDNTYVMVKGDYTVQ